VLALLFGRFIPGRFVPGSSVLDPCFGRVVEREFRAFWPSFLGVLFLDPRSWRSRSWPSFLGILFLEFLFLAFLFLALVLGVLFLDPCFGAFPGRIDPRFWILEWSAAARPTVACFGVGRELWS